MNDRILICIGGGEIKTKSTLEIDRYIANLVKSKNPNIRPMGLFIGTASYDSMPYFNSFRKTYTSEFDIKADCALICYNEMSMDKIADKINRASFIYVGGGDTVFMINKWKEVGLFDLIYKAYLNGTILCGLSAGAICWFENMFTDSKSVTGDDRYGLHKGLGILKGFACPHFSDRKEDFLAAFETYTQFDNAYLIDNHSALVFKNEELLGAVNAGGVSYYLTRVENKNLMTEIKSVEKFF